jgi:DNA-binding NarL/FixJ family response regulator
MRSMASLRSQNVKPTTGVYTSTLATAPGRKPKEASHSCNLPKDSLSPREAEVCTLLVEGLNVREAALGMNITFCTADSHRRNAYQKLGVHDRGALVRHFARPNVEAQRDLISLSYNRLN